VKVSDKISLSEKITKNPVVAQLLQNQELVIPTWLAKDNGVGTIISIPKRTDVDASISEQLVVEYYSK
jgi:ribosomal protein S4